VSERIEVPNVVSSKDGSITDVGLIHTRYFEPEHWDGAPYFVGIEIDHYSDRADGSVAVTLTAEDAELLAKNILMIASAAKSLNMEVTDFADAVGRAKALMEMIYTLPDPASAVREVPGVTKVEEIRDLEKGLLTLTVWGGDDKAVAEAIYHNKTIAILTLGNTSVMIHDPVAGFEFEIRFNRQPENQENYGADGSGGW
jgi:hypothetical protein